MSRIKLRSEVGLSSDRGILTTVPSGGDTVEVKSV